MEILTAIVLGVVAGLVMKFIFLKDAPVIWAAAFGVVGGVAAYYLQGALEGDVATAVTTTALALLVAGLLYEVWTRFGGKTGHTA